VGLQRADELVLIFNPSRSFLNPFTPHFSAVTYARDQNLFVNISGFTACLVNFLSLPEKKIYYFNLHSLNGHEIVTIQRISNISVLIVVWKKNYNNLETNIFRTAQWTH
jgi:hypothetical protein